MDVLFSDIEASARWVRLAFAPVRPSSALPWLHRSEAANTRASGLAEPLARDGERRAFESQILPLLDAAYSFARFLVRDPDVAHDVVQEAFLRAYRAYRGFQGGDPRAWLFSIVRNCCRDWQSSRSRARRFEVEPAACGSGEADDGGEPATDQDSPEIAAIRKSEAEQVRAILGRLPEPLREILVLRELEDLSYREIAAIIDAPIGTVMSRLARARSVFAAAWRDAEGKSSR